jgi:hypothetical protein
MLDVTALVATLRDGHLVLCGGDEGARLRLAEQILEAATDAETTVYRLSPGIGTRDEYLREARKLFPIQSPLGIDKRDMSLDQIDDVLLDWVEDEGGKTVIFWPEAGFSESLRADQVLSNYVTETFILDEPPTGAAEEGRGFRLLATTPADVRGVHREIELHIGRDESDGRTVEEIARRRLAVVSLDAGGDRSARRTPVQRPA